MSNAPNFGQFASRVSAPPVSPAEVGSDFTVRDHIVENVGSNTTLLIPSDPNRFALWVPRGAGGVTLFWNWHQFSSQDEAEQQTSTSIPRVYTYREIGALVTFPVYYRWGNGFILPRFYSISYRPQR